MKLYEVLEDCRGMCPYTSYGLFSTYEKAKDLIETFKEIDGFGVCVEDLRIKEVEIIPDKIEEWVLRLIENGKLRKKKYEERES